MRKSHTLALTLFAASLMLGANANAQQTPASNPPKPPAAAKAPVAKTPATTTPAAPAAKSESSSVLKTQKDKASYAVGLNIGKSMHNDSVDVDPSILALGIKDGITGGKPLLTDEEMKAALTALQ